MGNIVKWRVTALAYGMALTATIVLGGCTTGAIDSPTPPSEFMVLQMEGASIRSNNVTGRPECSKSQSIPLGASAPRSHVANAISAWNEPTITLEAVEGFGLVGIIARDGDLFGFHNIAENDVWIEAGETLSLKASHFTVMPLYTESIVRIDDLTLCIVPSTQP